MKLAVEVTMETAWKSLACVVIVVAVVASKVVPERATGEEFMNSQGEPRCPTQLADHCDRSEPRSKSAIRAERVFFELSNVSVFV